VLIVRSRHPVNMGYTWCAPGDNERMFLQTGEVVTQDLGYMDEDGFLYVSGRIDDVIVLGSGRNVLVRKVEERINEIPAVHQCVLYGQGKPFLIAIVSPATDGIDKASVEAHLKALNETALPEYQVRGLVIAPERFAPENGLLTPQFKLVRRAIYARFASEIQAAYDETVCSTWLVE
jgi:long-subunit acyl-CoA synthetase (AMP-forming)